MHQPLISVIVPAYNLEECLGRALDSILQQNIKDMEVIVVDDLSSDGTWELIKNMKRRQPNKIYSYGPSFKTIGS